MKRTILALAALAVSMTMSCGAVGWMSRCSGWTTQVSGLDLQASRSWTHDGDDGEDWGLLTVLINLSQQNTVTQVDMICSGSDDGNSTDYVFQECAVASGACTSSDATWEKTVAAADQWAWRVDTGGLPDWQCTISVGAGAGTSTDVITVKTRVCAKG